MAATTPPGEPGLSRALTDHELQCARVVASLLAVPRPEDHTHRRWAEPA
jgi:hypothetical protein